MSAPTRTIEDIVASVIREEQASHVRIGGMRGLLAGSAATFSALLLVDGFLPELAWPLEAIRPLGPPFRVLLVLGVLLEGLWAAALLARHEEPSYPLRAQANATGAASAGAILLGMGAFLAVLYSLLLGQYWPDLIVIAQIGVLILLVGAGTFLASLLPAACSILGFRGAEEGA